MNIPFDLKPFSEIPSSLRNWFQRVCDDAEVNSGHQFDRNVLPAGSTATDASIASRCLLALFADRIDKQRNTPVDIEFKL
jgi:hypothetical protein